MIIVLRQMSKLQLYHDENKLHFDDDDDDDEVDFYSTSSLKQQFAGRHDAPLGHIILIPSQPVFALNLLRT